MKDYKNTNLKHLKIIFFRQVREKDLVMPDQGNHGSLAFTILQLDFNVIKLSWKFIQHVSRDLSLILVWSKSDFLNPAPSWTDDDNIFIEIYLLNWQSVFFKY